MTNQRFVAFNADCSVFIVFSATFCAVNHFVHPYFCESANRKAVTPQNLIRHVEYKRYFIEDLMCTLFFGKNGVDMTIGLVRLIGFIAKLLFW